MIDANRPAVPEIVPEQLDEELIAAGAQLHRIGRRQSPILPFRRKGIGRSPAIGLVRQHLLESPSVCTVAITAQREVVIQTQRHPGLIGLHPHGDQLFGRQPLHILKEPHSLHMPALELSNGVTRGHAIGLRPIRPHD